MNINKLSEEAVRTWFNLPLSIQKNTWSHCQVKTHENLLQKFSDETKSYGTKNDNACR